MVILISALNSIIENYFCNGVNTVGNIWISLAAGEIKLPFNVSYFIQFWPLATTNHAHPVPAKHL